MKKLLLALSAVVLLCGTASATALEFDPTGTGNFTPITALGLESHAELDDNPEGVFIAQDIWSYEDADGNFTEQFTLFITNADLTNGTQWVLSSYGLYADVELTGIADVPNALVTFTSGTAKIYIDGDGNSDFDAGELSVADFELMAPGYMMLSDTVLGLNLSGEVDLVFRFTETYDDFWAQEVDDLADMGWVMSFMAGRINAEDIIPLDNGGNIIGWDVNDFDAEFTVVPEPSTLILLGCGLVGIAAVGRKRFSKKN